MQVGVALLKLCAVRRPQICTIFKKPAGRSSSGGAWRTSPRASDRRIEDNQIRMTPPTIGD